MILWWFWLFLIIVWIKEYPQICILLQQTLWTSRDIECCSFQSCSNSGHGLVAGGGSSSFYIVPKKGKESNTNINQYGCWTKNTVFTPPNHPFVHRVVHYFAPSILGYHYSWKHPYQYISQTILTCYGTS